MRKTYRLDGLCCANCALKIENSISKLNGVKNVSLNFMTTKLIIEANEDLLPYIIEETRKIIKRIEPEIKIV